MKLRDYMNKHSNIGEAISIFGDFIESKKIISKVMYLQVISVIVRSFNHFIAVYKSHFIPYCTYNEKARILGYQSRSNLYKIRKDWWLKHY